VDRAFARGRCGKWIRHLPLCDSFDIRHSCFVIVSSFVGVNSWLGSFPSRHYTIKPIR
jgi:hypothetical protein